MKTGVVVPVVLAAVLAAIAGCGSDDKGHCGDVAPCGGDVVGEWRFSTVCYGTSFEVPSCAAATLDSSARTTTGVMTFRADMTYNVDATVGGSDKITFPADCYGGPGLVDCREVEAELLGATDLDTTARCTGSFGGCVCWLSYRLKKSYEMGKYAVANNVVTYTFNNQTATQDYCVQGNELNLTETRIVSNGLGNRAVASSFVLTRK